MNYKKLTSLLIIPALFCQTSVFAAKLSIDEIKLDLNTVTINGNIDSAENSEILMYVTENGENPQKNDVNYVTQVTAAQNGQFTAQFQINEDIIKGDGKLTLYANCENADSPVKMEFLYVDSLKRKALIDGINGAQSAAEIKSVIEANSDICSALGMSMAADISKELFDGRPSQGYTEENLVIEYNTKVFLKVINSEKNPDTVVSYFEMFNELINSRNPQAEKFIAEVIIENIPYDSLTDLNKEYEKGSAFDEINKSGRDDLTDILKKYEDLIEISSDSKYIEYKNAASEKQVFITKKLIEKASSTPFKTCEDIINVIDEAIDSWKNKDSSGGNSSGSGTGGPTRPNSGNSSSGPTISTPHAGQNLENVMKNEEEVSEKLSFSDVGENFWGKNAIETLAEMGILNGDNGFFRPNDKITREEFVTVVVNAFSLYDDNAVCNFSDTDTDAWYYKYVASAYVNGIISGTGDGNFGIGESIKREDVAVILSRILNEETDSVPNFTDTDIIADYAKNGVALMQEKGIISGMEDGSFLPKNNCTRAEAATMIYLLLDMQGGINK